ncbi:unnamed protein product [Acanthosepion pharaonis]|uniref:Uncharacterized protein n=1 Tax=Acanthosepion pharaonis TaxID=158019 RepID=A0A812BVB9_ACAPH|nr:unnamed protein product [Sepia pharaonis]
MAILFYCLTHNQQLSFSRRKLSTVSSHSFGSFVLSSDPLSHFLLCSLFCTLFLFFFIILFLFVIYYSLSLSLYPLPSFPLIFSFTLSLYSLFINSYSHSFYLFTSRIFLFSRLLYSFSLCCSLPFSLFLSSTPYLLHSFSFYSHHLPYPFLPSLSS